MRLQIYSNLINQLPIEQQAIEVNLKNWNKYIPKNYKKTFKGIFCNKDLIIRENTIQISRHDLFKEGEKKNIYRFILMTLMWGYPSGMRGKNIPNILGPIPSGQLYISKFPFDFKEKHLIYKRTSRRESSAFVAKIEPINRGRRDCRRFCEIVIKR